jgi:hypothetical protein
MRASKVKIRIDTIMLIYKELSYILDKIDQ